MIKSLLFYIGLLLLPSAVYLAWLFVFRRPAAKAGGWLSFREGPWVWLLMGGLAMVVISLVYLGLTSGYDIEGTYMPPRYEEGELLPAEVE